MQPMGYGDCLAEVTPGARTPNVPLMQQLPRLCWDQLLDLCQRDVGGIQPTHMHARTIGASIQLTLLGQPVCPEPPEPAEGLMDYALHEC